MRLIDTQFPLVVFLAISVVFLIRFSMRAARAYRFLRLTELPYRAQWLDFDALDMPASVQAADTRLRELGFVPFIVERNVYPPMKVNQTLWNYHNADGSIYAAVQDSKQPQRPVSVGFGTWFTDDALIVTEFPRTMTLETRDLHYRFAAYSLQAALLYHEFMVDKWRREHGDPIPITDAAAIERTDAIHARKHRRTLYRRFIRMQLAYSVSAAAAAVSLVIALPFYFIEIDPLQPSPWFFIVLVMAFIWSLLMVGVALYGTWTARRQYDPSLAVDAEFKYALIPKRPAGQHPLNADPVEVDI
jgi:hypothetical protein